METPPIRERLTPAVRFQRDPAFATLVNLLESFLHTTEFTPTEIREAALLAAVNYEMRRRFVRPIHIISGIAEVEPSARPGEPPELLRIDGQLYQRVEQPLRRDPYRSPPTASEPDAVPPLGETWFSRWEKAIKEGR